MKKSCDYGMEYVMNSTPAKVGGLSPVDGASLYRESIDKSLVGMTHQTVYTEVSKSVGDKSLGTSAFDKLHADRSLIKASS